MWFGDMTRTEENQQREQEVARSGYAHFACTPHKSDTLKQILERHGFFAGGENVSLR